MRLRLRKLPNININNLKSFQHKQQQDHHILNSTNQDITIKILSRITNLNTMRVIY